MVKVAFVTPELASLVRRTHLSGVAEDLAQALRQAGNDTRVFLPHSGGVDTRRLQDQRQAAVVSVADAQGQERFTVRSGKIGDLPVYLFANERLFGDRFPYGDDDGPYEDNWRRYALFSRAVLASLAALDFPSAVLHGMDWTTGLLPLLQKLDYLDPGLDHPASGAGTFFSIHNLAMQGSFEREILPRIGIPQRYFRGIEGVEHGGKVNFMKAGVEFANILGTHSPTHARTIQQRDRGYGLEEAFNRRTKDLVGIHNGIDYASWDPSSDPLLAGNFSAQSHNLQAKKKCKSSLQHALQLDQSQDTILACHIGRWDADSGFDLLAEVLGSILEREVQLAVMGAGGEDIAKRLRTIESTFIGRLRVIEGYDPGAAHRAMGGADLMLLPSHYQPSNSLAAIALRYGVVPLIYARSGLEESVPSVREDARAGLGFHFAPYTGDGLLDGVLDAQQYFGNRTKWNKLVKRDLAQDFSWGHAAAEYQKVYRRGARRVKSR